MGSLLPSSVELNVFGTVAAVSKGNCALGGGTVEAKGGGSVGGAMEVVGAGGGEGGVGGVSDSSLCKTSKKSRVGGGGAGGAGGAVAARLFAFCNFIKHLELMKICVVKESKAHIHCFAHLQVL